MNPSPLALTASRLLATAVSDLENAHASSSGFVSQAVATLSRLRAELVELGSGQPAGRSPLDAVARLAGKAVASRPAACDALTALLSLHLQGWCTAGRGDDAMGGSGDVSGAVELLQQLGWLRHPHGWLLHDTSIIPTVIADAAQRWAGLTVDEIADEDDADDDGWDGTDPAKANVAAALSQCMLGRGASWLRVRLLPWLTHIVDGDHAAVLTPRAPLPLSAPTHRLAATHSLFPVAETGLPPTPAFLHCSPLQMLAARAVTAMHEAVVLARGETVFDTVRDYPATLPALLDMRRCIAVLGAPAVDALRGHLLHALRLRLLHHGAATSTLLDLLQAAIRALAVAEDVAVEALQPAAAIPVAAHGHGPSSIAQAAGDASILTCGGVAPGVGEGEFPRLSAPSRRPSPLTCPIGVAFIAVAVTRPLTGAACDLIGRHLQARPDALRAIVTTMTTDTDSDVRPVAVGGGGGWRLLSPTPAPTTPRPPSLVQLYKELTRRPQGSTVGGVGESTGVLGPGASLRLALRKVAAGGRGGGGGGASSGGGVTGDGEFGSGVDYDSELDDIDRHVSGETAAAAALAAGPTGSGDKVDVLAEALEVLGLHRRDHLHVLPHGWYAWSDDEVAGAVPAAVNDLLLSLHSPLAREAVATTVLPLRSLGHASVTGQTGDSCVIAPFTADAAAAGAPSTQVRDASAGVDGGGGGSVCVLLRPSRGDGASASLRTVSRRFRWT